VARPISNEYVRCNLYACQNSELTRRDQDILVARGDHACNESGIWPSWKEASLSAGAHLYTAMHPCQRSMEAPVCPDDREEGDLAAGSENEAENGGSIPCLAVAQFNLF
jgi:hypothetical protein